MAVIETHRRHGFRAATPARLTAVMRSLALSMREWNDVRATRAALRKLSDRELEDIGLNRGDIETLDFQSIRTTN